MFQWMIGGFLLLLTSQTAMAAGRVNYTLKTREGFSRVDVREDSGEKTGMWYNFGQRIDLASSKDGERFHLPLPMYPNDGLVYTVFNEVHTSYRGFLFFNFGTHIDSYKDRNKGTIRMKGNIGEKMKFEYISNVDKKGRKSATMYFSESTEFANDMVFHIQATPEKSEGSCRGRLSYGVDTLATITCASSGTLKDAFFWSEEDVIAWIVHLLVIPSDDNGNEGKLMARLTRPSHRH